MTSWLAIRCRHQRQATLSRDGGPFQPPKATSLASNYLDRRLQSKSLWPPQFLSCEPHKQLQHTAWEIRTSVRTCSEVSSSCLCSCTPGQKSYTVHCMLPDHLWKARYHKELMVLCASGCSQLSPVKPEHLQLVSASATQKL